MARKFPPPPHLPLLPTYPSNPKFPLAEVCLLPNLVSSLNCLNKI